MKLKEVLQKINRDVLEEVIFNYLMSDFINLDDEACIDVVKNYYNDFESEIHKIRMLLGDIHLAADFFVQRYKEREIRKGWANGSIRM